MQALLTLIKREFTAYFLSPIAYVTLAVFLFVTGHLFYLTMVALTEGGPQGIEYPMQGLLGDEKFWLVFLLIPPLLTMRLLAEERGTGTLEMLLTAPSATGKSSPASTSARCSSTSFWACRRCCTSRCW